MAYSHEEPTADRFARRHSVFKVVPIVATAVVGSVALDNVLTYYCFVSCKYKAVGFDR